MTQKTLYTIMTIFYIVIFSIIALPLGTAMVDRVQPHILGLPCYQACILYGSLLMALGLIVWFFAECKIEDRQIAKDETIEEVEKQC